MLSSRRKSHHDPQARRLFNGLLVWGLSMSVVGAMFCWILFG